jgi:hypothetical protein
MTLRLSAAEFRQLQQKQQPRDPMKAMRALGRLPAGEMNKTEARYAAHLNVLKNLGLIKWWAFEAITLHLAPRTTYRPDFLVLTRDDLLEVHETKGYWTDDARVKVKVAAAMFPLVFKAVTVAKGGGWDIEEF